MQTARLLTIRQAARAYGVPETAVRSWAKQGAIYTVSAGSRTYIPSTAIEKFIRGEAREGE